MLRLRQAREGEMLERTVTEDGEVIGWFVGYVDAAAGREAGPLLRASTAAGPVTLDFSRAWNVDYYGLAALASELVQTDLVVRLRGLHENHVRTLTYFGVEPSRFGIGKNVDVRRAPLAPIDR